MKQSQTCNVARPGMCHFDEVWHYISSKVCPPGMADRVRIELPFAVFGTPLFHTWLGTKVDDVTTCSDASQQEEPLPLLASSPRKEKDL